MRCFLGHYNNQILACDCFTVETIRLQTIQVLFFIELGTRRLSLAGCTTDPDTVWVTQQARQRVWELNDPTQRCVSSFTTGTPKFPIIFDRVSVSEGIMIVRTRDLLGAFSVEDLPAVHSTITKATL